MNSEDFIRIAEYIKENYVSKEEWENDLVAHTLINIQYSIEHIEKILEKLWEQTKRVLLLKALKKQKA